MKLLVITQKVDQNDDLLGFFHGWIYEFANCAEKVTVVALGVGEYHLPENVKVLSLGKEAGQSKLKYLFRFYKYIWSERKNYDTVFAHMNKEYVIMGGLLWRLTGKKIGLWYVHKEVSFQLRLAELLANIIFTSSEESFNLPSKKLKIIGHGIDLEQFSYSPRPDHRENFRIIYVGRISRIKNQKLLIEAINFLVNKNSIKNIKVDLVGSPVYQDDQVYQDELIWIIKSNKLENYINFCGSVPHKDIAEVYQRADLSVNLCPTGGMDKAVLESMAGGLPVILLNETFANILENYKSDLILTKASEFELAEKIIRLREMAEDKKLQMTKNLKAIVNEQYDIKKLIGRIINSY
ncbi:hypothetical protein COX74_01410 [bacterium (Candidatus Gribaldobacteria) CG_4_10_14_0_2_um_filter_41_16]|uniref:Glycosyl transferase family 1 domain-containing protein n=2 Tax=Candidatus Gribaldobacteria TaxID=2798536 RepID=A0A2M7VIM7_9BACT|nr:MAG: hypothetical protein COU03_00025 [bacterium (Candidatus Gribaldobacteria) CG10_big_fil_rev_8_21_14_0_10_41_12]PJA01690.1 MAG: hypothetical protein COX74_01410 [bacterium (Candidatus Gribaldobacteria) CG_4_10_14_0_2_um_filter_41_16]